MDNNLSDDVANIMKSAQSLINKIQTGEGLGIPEEKKAEFKEQIKKNNVEKLVEDLKTKMENLKTTIKNTDGATH